METFSTAAAETEAPRPCPQIALTNNPIEIRTVFAAAGGTPALGKCGLDGQRLITAASDHKVRFVDLRIQDL